VSRNLKNIESERNKTALAYLKSQINPHFLFNTFNSIYGLAVKEKADNTANGMLKLSGILRYVLTETQSDFVSLQKEIDYIQNYIELQRLRIDAKTNLKYQVSGNASDCVIAPLLMIPFIENAFKYGINPGIEAQISISISVQEKALELKVFNKKIVQRRDTDTPKGNGIGIENTKKRLALLYPQKYTLEIQETHNDFEVYLKLQLT
jgi:LytS/YehU family sensor histidine kinase